jgi:hypothetical protein
MTRPVKLMTCKECKHFEAKNSPVVGGVCKLSGELIHDEWQKPCAKFDVNEKLILKELEACVGSLNRAYDMAMNLQHKPEEEDIKLTLRQIAQLIVNIDSELNGID